MLSGSQSGQIGFLSIGFGEIGEQMSETISQLPTVAGDPALSDIMPVTRGYTGPGTGTNYATSIAVVLSANDLVYATDPRYGVKADGVTDDTTAWGAALSAAFNLGTWVVAPIG